MSKKVGLILFLVIVVGSSLLYWYLSGRFEPTETYSLIDATEKDIVSAEFRGTGYCSGDSIELRIKSKVENRVSIEIKLGWILINSGAGQNMITAEERTFTVEPKAELEVTIEAYCLDIHRNNPSTVETLMLQNDTGVYQPEVAKLMEFVKTAPEMRRSISAVQIALWILLGDISEDDVLIDFSYTDIADAKWLLDNMGVNVSERKILRELLERPPLPIKVTQHSIFDDGEAIHILGEVENIGEREFRWIEIRALLYDSSDTLLDISTTSAMRDYLLPGDISPFHIKVWKGGDRYSDFERYEVWPGYALNTTDIPYREFQVSNATVEEKDGKFRATCVVTNIGEKTLWTPKLVVSIYDNSGKLIGCGHDYFSHTAQTYSFEIEEILTGTIGHWVFYVEG